MNERTTFEMRLETMFAGYADRAPVEVDAAGLASQIAAARPRRAYDRMTARNRWLVPALIGLLLIATLAATVYVAAQLLTPRVIGYDEHFAIGADISDPRPNPIAVALADGRVLISTGWDGDGGEDQVQAQIYDPETGESEPLDGDKPYGGDGAGIRLADGRVLLVVFSMNTTSSRAYLVDPANSSVRELEQDESNAPPFGVLPSMALLKDGRVLIAGGQSDVFSLDMLATAVLFDPATESFNPTGSMSEPRTNHSLITLRDGRVLAVGGDLAMDHGSIGDSTGSTHLISSAEIYDPNKGEFAPTAGLTSFEGRTLGVLLTDGRVAVLPQIRADPMTGNPEPETPTQIEIYDPGTGTFVLAGSTLYHPDVAFALRDGRILMTGSGLVPMNMVGPGEYWDRYQPWALVFDPTTGESVSMPPPRAESSGAAVLPDGRVLFAGGMAYPPPDANGNGTGEAFPVPWVDIFE